MGKPNYSVFRQLKRVWVAGHEAKKHYGSTQKQSHLKLIPDGSPQWEIVVADYLVTFETWLLLEKLGNSHWIW